MNKRGTLILSILFHVFNTIQSQGYDQNWITGFHENNDEGPYGNAVVKFISGGEIEISKQNLNMNFERTCALISDSMGQHIMLYSNGCQIANSNGDIISGSDLLNPGEVRDFFCPSTGYIVTKGALFLPAPQSNSKYYLIHLGAKYDSRKHFSYGPLYYTLVDVSMNNGTGAVVEINEIINEANPESFGVVRHGNGRDWWILVPEYRSNRIHIYLVSDEGIHFNRIIESGPNGNCPRVGSIVFSDDGSRFARIQNCLTSVYDFNRCTAETEYIKSYERPNYVFGGGGGFFSNDGRYLAISEHLAIMYADISDNSAILDTLVPFDSLIGRCIGMPQRGPDGYLYFNQTHRSRYMPGLNNFYADSNTIFNKKGILLPVYSAQTLPYFPNFRLYDLPGSLCDTLDIDTPVSVYTTGYPEKLLKIYPNPAGDVVSFEIRGVTLSKSYMIRTIQGIEILSGFFTDQITSINIGSYPAGMYILECQTDSGERYREMFLIAR